MTDDVFNKIKTRVMAQPGSTATDLALSLVAEVERLRAELAQERAAAVAWLRAEMQPCSGPVRGTLAYAANSIERGEYRREEER